MMDKGIHIASAILTSSELGELPLVFGTSSLRGPDTQIERETSQYMQQAWLAFVKNPNEGLRNYGWPVFNATTKSLIQLGLQNNVSAVVTSGNAYDAGCN